MTKPERMLKNGAVQGVGQRGRQHAFEKGAGRAAFGSGAFRPRPVASAQA